MHKRTSTIVLYFSDNKGIALVSKLTNYQELGKVLDWSLDYSIINDWELIYEN